MKDRKLNFKYQALFGLIFISSFLILITSLVQLQFSQDNLILKNKNLNQIFLLISVCSLILMTQIYFYLIFRKAENTSELTEKQPIIRFKYEKKYWRNFKKKEFIKNAILSVIKIVLFGLPINFFLYHLLNQGEIKILIIFLMLFVIALIPIIVYFFRKYYLNVRNQLFSEKYEVKIFKTGLTINNAYYPYDQYVNIFLQFRLIDVKKLELNNCNCLKFIARKTKSLYSIEGPRIKVESKTKILIPIPQNVNRDKVIEKILERIK